MYHANSLFGFDELFGGVDPFEPFYDLMLDNGFIFEGSFMCDEGYEIREYARVGVHVSVRVNRANVNVVVTPLQN
jgi:hypothetical protein